MADKPTVVPRWASGGGASITEPTEGKKDVGHVVAERPPAQIFNWLFNTIYLWILWLTGIFSSTWGYYVGPALYFRENWIGYATAGVQPTMRPWRVLSVASDADTAMLMRIDVSVPAANIYPGTSSASDLWLLTGEVNGAGPAVITNTGAFFDASVSGIKTYVEWHAALTAATGDNTTWYQGLDDAAQTAKAFNNDDAGGGHGTFAAFYKGTGQTRWTCVTGDGSAYTTTNQTVSATVAVNVRQRLGIEYDTTGTPTVRFYVNGVLVATHTTHLPGVPLRLAFGGRRGGACVPNHRLIIEPLTLAVGIVQ